MVVPGAQMRQHDAMLVLRDCLPPPLFSAPLFSDCVPLFAPHLAARADERLAIAYFGADGALLKLRLEGGACPGAVAFPLREVVRDVLDMEATGIVLAHNHPSGRAAPSASDRHITRTLAMAVRPLDVRLLDHFIFGGEEVASFRALGLL